MNYYIYTDLNNVNTLVHDDGQGKETILATDTVDNLKIKLKELVKSSHKTTKYLYEPTQNKVTDYTCKPPKCSDAKVFCK